MIIISHHENKLILRLAKEHNLTIFFDKDIHENDFLSIEDENHRLGAFGGMSFRKRPHFVRLYYEGLTISLTNFQEKILEAPDKSKDEQVEQFVSKVKVEDVTKI